MAKLASILLFFAISQTAFTQQGTTVRIDSGGQLRSRVDSLNHQLDTDSLQTNWQNKIDSIKSSGNVNRYRDSLKVVGWVDSLRTSVASSFAKKQNAIYNQVDSLLIRNQPTGALQRKSDSLGRKQQVLMTEINQK